MQSDEMNERTDWHTDEKSGLWWWAIIHKVSEISIYIARHCQEIISCKSEILSLTWSVPSAYRSRVAALRSDRKNVEFGQ